ncbi:MAG: hypothetical protein Q7S55_03465 [Nanoarchaeota archaeon]|nr:hypothetical protein [Nanoarchaeota archaeon]
MFLGAAAEVAAGYMYVKVFENLAHKYLLHDLGKKKESLWRFHFHEHHKAAIKHGMLDPAYFEPWWLNHSRAKEVASLIGAFGVHLPLAKKHPYFVAGVGIGVLEYYYKHKKSHTEPEWAWEHMQNHVKHHLLGQNNYWGVTSGLVDRLVGTAPTISGDEWIALRVFNMRRYNGVREKAEEMAKERSKEHKEKLRESLEGLAEKLYSFLGRK